MNPATFPVHFTPASPPPAGGMAALAEVRLSPTFEPMLEHAGATAGGPAHWQLSKLAELHDLFALVEISGRLRIEWFDASADLRVVLAMRSPVPLRGPQPNAPLEIGPFARLGLIYRQEVLVAPQPGYSFVQILAPLGLWHPNVSRDENQVVCLGPHLPVGIPLKKIVLMTYGALTLQTIQFSAADSAGVLTVAAADWWQRNLQRIPLSREPFIFKPTVRS